MNRRSPQQNQELWKERIGRFEKSDTTVAKFCQQQGCSQASFYYWRRRLRQQPADPTPTFLPVRLAAPLESLQPPPTGSMSVELPGGVRIRFVFDADPASTTERRS